VSFVLSELPNPGFRSQTRGSISNRALVLLLGAIVVTELRKLGFFARRDPYQSANLAAAGALSGN